MRRIAIVLLATNLASAQPGVLEPHPMRALPEGAPLEPSPPPDPHELMCNLRAHHDCECGGLPANPMFGRPQVRQLNRYFGACFDSAHGMHGRLVIRVIIAASGRVTTAQAIQDTVGNPAFTTCTLYAFKRLRFGPFPRSTAPGVLEIPLSFASP